MTDQIKYVKDIQIIKSEKDPELLLVRAIGIAELRELVVPVLQAGEDNCVSEDGIYELDFKFDSPGNDGLIVEVVLETELRIQNLPHNIKAIKIKASENADIELIE